MGHIGFYNLVKYYGHKDQHLFRVLDISFSTWHGKIDVYFSKVMIGVFVIENIEKFQ